MFLRLEQRERYEMNFCTCAAEARFNRAYLDQLGATADGVVLHSSDARVGPLSTYKST